MFLYRSSIVILFIPIAIGVNDLNKTASKVESAHNITSTSSKKLLQKEDNSTRKEIPMPIEGGEIMVAPSNPSLLKENDSVLLSKLPSMEFGDSYSKTKQKHVVGRTGAPVIPDLKEIAIKTPDVQKNNNTTKLSTTTTTTTTTTAPPPSPTKPPHKPLVLRFEENSIIAEKLSQPGISAGTTTSQVNKPGSHPGMIMPIVITILIVPLFAVLGYMALKRGQEAWKNRHYKRMDFLLDGMYND